MVDNGLLDAATTAAASKIPDWYAVLVGFGTVFVGLICIVILCKIVGAICKKAVKPQEEAKPQTAISGEIENRQEILAAVTAVCAENMGKDISAVRVVSFKKIN